MSAGLTRSQIKSQMSKTTQEGASPSGAAIVVAGSTCSDETKAHADVVATGTDDEDTIQDAIDNLTSGRTWTETVKLIGLFNIGSVITGADYTSLDLRDARLKLQASADCNVLDFSDTYDCAIIGGRLNGNKANTASGSGIVATDCEILRILDTYVYDFSEYGIKMVNTAGSKQAQIWIANSNVSGCESWGIYLYGHGTPGYSSDYHLSHCKLATNYGGIYLYKMEYGEVDGCLVSDSTTSVGLYVRDCGSAIVRGGNYRGNVSNGRGVWVGNSQRIVLDGIFLEANLDASSNEQDIYIDGTSHDVTVLGCNVDPNATATGHVKGIYVATGAYNISVVGNDVADLWTATSAATVKPIYLEAPVGDHVVVANNAGYIHDGEVRTLSGKITTLTQNAYNSIDNPFDQDVLVESIIIYVSTKATSTEPNIDVGIGSSATTDYTTLFNDLPGETVGAYHSVHTATIGQQTTPILWQTGTGNRYLNMSIKAAAATGMVATYMITVRGATFTW